MSFVFDETAVAEYATDIAETADVAGMMETVFAVLKGHDSKLAREHC